MDPIASRPDGRERLSPVRPGDLLAGKYRVERVLGVGGMGVVVAARHEALRQRVALKFLLPELGVEHEALERFAREARAMASLRGEHVTRVLDVGTLESGAPYFVMEYLEGEDLARACRRRGALPADEAVAYVLQACEALAEAHRAGLVHRDLKPANLFLTRGVDGAPFVKVLDFGVSKATSGTRGGATDLTATSALMGSPRYMAPEQLRDARRVDPRADVWSLGVVLHELLAGESPFAAETLPELHVAILQGAPRPLRGRRPELSPALEAAIARCLEKDPDRRFPHVAAFAEALGPFAPPSARHAVERIASVLGLAPPTQHGPAPPPAPLATSASLAAHPSAATSRPAGATATLPTPPPSHLASHAFASYPAGHASAPPPLGHASAAPPPAGYASAAPPPVGYASAAPPPLGNASASYLAGHASAAPPLGNASASYPAGYASASYPPAGHASVASYPPVGHASASSHPAGYASAASPSAGYTLPTPLPSAAPGRAPRAVPPTVADSPAPALLESAARPSNVYLPPSVPPAPAPVPFPFEGNWGREPAPLAPIPPPLAPAGSSSSRAIAAIVLAAIVLAVAFAGCAVCGGILLGL